MLIYKSTSRSEGSATCSYFGINNIIFFGVQIILINHLHSISGPHISLPFVCVDIHFIRMENWLLVKLKIGIFLYGLSLKVNILSETINSNILQIPVFLYRRGLFIRKPIWGPSPSALFKPKLTYFMLKCIIINVKRKKKVFNDLAYGVNSKMGSNTRPVINVNHNPDVFIFWWIWFSTEAWRGKENIRGESTAVSTCTEREAGRLLKTQSFSENIADLKFLNIFAI